MDRNTRRQKYVGVGGDDIPSLGILEADILRLLWDAGEPQSAVQVYEAMHHSHRIDGTDIQSPSTIAVTLGRMVNKGLLTVKRARKGGKGYYQPARSRSEIVVEVLEDVSLRLVGLPIGALLHILASNPDIASTGNESNARRTTVDDLIKELRRRQACGT